MGISIVRKLGTAVFTRKFHDYRHRATALFFVLVMLTAALMPAGQVYAQAVQNQPPDDDKPMAQNVVAPLETKPLTQKTAADYQAPTVKSGGGLPGDGKTTGPSAANVAGLAAPNANPAIQTGEVMDKRTRNSTTTRQADGKLKIRQYTSSKFYQKDGKWEDIDTKLVEDINSADAGNPVGVAFGALQSLVKAPNAYTVKGNDWKARFAPSGSQQAMVRVEMDGKQLGFSPVGGKDGVTPVITTDDRGDQTVHYYDLWPGVNVEYLVGADELKENIILKDKDATRDFKFQVDGGGLSKKNLKKGEIAPAYDVTGDLAGEFAIAPFGVVLNTYGPESAGTALQHSFADGVMNVSLSQDYLQKLPADAYPLALDPTVVNKTIIGTRSGGAYASFKSDGFVCDSTICNPYAGSVLDSASIWRNWRGIMHADYSAAKGKQIDNAKWVLKQRTGLPVSGDTGNRLISAWHADCWSYSCKGAFINSVTMATLGTIDATNYFRGRQAAGDWNAATMLTGEEDVAQTTYKNFDPGTGNPDIEGSFLEMTITDVIPAPTIITPAEGQVYVDPQVSFSATPNMTNPVSGAKLQYEFCVSTSPACGGAVMVSGVQTGPLWTIPDNMLQDGLTYYVQGRTYDPTPTVQVYSNYGVPKSFRIDLRTGKDSTQAYDTLGPVSVDLATGNLSTSAASHSSAALGGSMGISLDYNSPVKSRRGLVGEYWGNTAFSGSPALTRVDQTVNFDWGTGTPQAGTITGDFFAGRWTGYFVAPTTGSYYFGGNVDDNYSITINNQAYFSGPCCGESWGTTAIAMTAGQVVPIKVEMQEHGGSAKMLLLVKGAVPAQPIPAEWLQTGVRPVAQTTGLTGSYYRDPDLTKDFAGTNVALMMQRTDPVVSFNWDTQPAMPNGPADRFLVRWTGYVTAPASGSYEFGTVADDGTRIFLGNTSTQILNNWVDNGSVPQWGSAFSMTAGQPVPITVEYYENGGGASMSLMVRSSGAGVAEQVVPTTWLSQGSAVLPNGWNLGLDSDGNISYDRLKATSTSVILTDSTGSTHEYVANSNSKAYKSPVNEDSTLTQNDDGTYTLQDSDGRTYVFKVNGTLDSVTSPTDDLKPAALKYVYGGTPSRLTEITDGVTASRWAKVYYYGDATNCPSAVTGFDTPSSSAALNKLCSVKTDDGRMTSIYYKDGNLARILQPGNETTDYQYDTLGRIISIRDIAANDALTAGVRADDASVLTELTYDILGRAAAVKQPAATTGASRTEHTLEYLPSTASYAGTTQQHITGSTEPNGYSRRVEYDKLFRTIVDKDIAALADKTEWHEYKDMTMSTTDETGLKSTTIYDDDDRVVSNYGPAPASWYDTWKVRLQPGESLTPGQSIKSVDGRYYLILQTDSNLVLYSPTAALWSSNTGGQGATSVVMQADGNLVMYNAGNALWASGAGGKGNSYAVVQDDGNLVTYRVDSGATWSTNTGGNLPNNTTSTYNKPLTAYANQVPHSDTAYDENISGTSVAYYQFNQNSNALTGAPKLHSTNLVGSASTNGLDRNYGTTPPISGVTDWGFRATGKMRLPTAGQWNFKVNSDDGARLYIDDVLQLNDWKAGSTRTHPVVGYPVTADSLHKFRLEYFHAAEATSPDGSSVQLCMTPPGGTETCSNINQYFKPNYDLATSKKVYDSTVGDVTTTTNYGANPELGLGQSTTVDPTGLGLTSSASYEQQGATGSFLRQTSITTPGSQTTNPTLKYDHYAATDVRDNPCTVGTTESYRQAGFMKIKTEASPGGTTGGGGSGAVPVVQSSSNASVSSGNLTLNKPTGTTDGDLLVMTVNSDLSAAENMTYTVPSGWTQTLANTRSSASNAGTNLQVWYKVASSEPASYTVTPDHSRLTGGSILRITGQAASSFIATQNVTAVDTGAEASAPSVTTTSANNLVLRLTAWDGNKTLTTAPNGVTQSYYLDANGLDQWGGYQSQTTAGATGVAQWDLSSTSPYVGFTLAIAPATSGGGGTPIPGRTSETIYDDAGRVVASRMNSDPWTCMTYDTRGRATQVVAPTINGRTGRTVSTNYAYSGSPFKVRVDDSVSGAVIQETDLLGRGVSGTDQFGNVSTVVYDNLGKVTSRTSVLGTETYAYDTYNRVTSYLIGGVTYATVTYDAYSRVQDITYNQAKPAAGGGSGAAPVVQSSTSGTVSSGALTLNKPTSTVTGDLLVMTASADLDASENVTYTVPSGWTQVLANTRSDAASAGNNLQVWYKVATASEAATYAITPDHNNLIGGSITRITGQDATAPIDVQAVTASLTGEASAPTVTTAAANDTVLRIATWDQSKTLITAPSGVTNSYYVDVSGHDNWGGSQTQATAGATGVAQWDLSGASPYVGYTLAIKAAATGGGGTPTPMKLEQIKRDTLSRSAGAVYRFSDGTAFDESVTRSQSGGVISNTDAFNGSTVTNTYSYDKAGRLLEAVVDKIKHTYGYGAPSATTCNQTNANLNSQKNGNRTSYTKTNTTTSQVLTSSTYCYDQADRLLTTSDSQVGTPTYDDHGNTATLAGNGTPVNLTYDALDSNTVIEQGVNKVEYLKTGSGSVLRKKEYVSGALTKSYRYLAGGAIMQTCSLSDQNSCTTTDAYLSLPGGVTLTLAPAHPDTTKRTVYSIKNFHGDTAMTANATGAPSSSVYLYEPYGQPSASTTFGTNGDPTNATTGVLGWAAAPTRKAETQFSLAIMQMGARTYLPGIGRLAQVDPISGGSVNGYAYVVDPINTDDYSGLYCLQCAAGVNFLQPATPAQHHQDAAPTQRIQPSVGYAYSVPSRAKINVTANNVSAPPSKPAMPVIQAPDAGKYLTNGAKSWQTSNYIEGDGKFNSYVNVGVGGGLKIGPLKIVPGGAIGIKVSPDSGFHPYITQCTASTGVGGSVSVGNGAITTGWAKEVSAYLGPGGSVDDGGYEGGFGSRGYCAGFTYTW